MIRSSWWSWWSWQTWPSAPRLRGDDPVSYGLVIGIVARNQLHRAGNVEAGAGLARWAMIIGALGTAGNLLFVVIWVSFVASALAQH
ncbi:hypothetical protein [Microbacterium trichothecenolyticum]|uniref:DUF4190 domain-containing protein n=1 Tax=Microbacterium trichothecenolyticum TaxID=69370 RepID=A0ABU0TWG6_MICTR|nr:hypothetical protein [Microbacterium trichothecenolyticum]MDQ1123855.1 hypothetical protein [Microbacterium trichothecenolyticum]